MNVNEDKYLRDKIIRVIARQKEGKVVIAPTKMVVGFRCERISGKR